MEGTVENALRERQRLMEENMGLAYMMAHRYKNSGLEFDDLVGICFLGLAKAATVYDREKSKFATFSTVVMKNEVLKELQKLQKEQAHSYDEENAEGVSKLGFLTDRKEWFEELMVKEVYHSGVKNLTEKERFIVESILIDGLNQSEVAHKLKISQSYTSRVYRAALIKMQKSIGGMYGEADKRKRRCSRVSFGEPKRKADTQQTA